VLPTGLATAAGDRAADSTSANALNRPSSVLHCSEMFHMAYDVILYVNILYLYYCIY